MSSWRVATVTIILLSVLCEICVAISPIDKTGNKLSETYLNILEQGVDCFEPLYSENASSCGPDTGFYDFRRYGNWTHPRNEPYHTLCMIPGNGQVILSYAVLLKYTEQQYFGIKRISRESLFEHTRKTIRWICKTSAYVENPCPFLPEIRKDLASGKQWKRRWGLRQDLLGYFSIGVAVLWDDLDKETKKLFKQTVAGTALRGRVVRTADKKGNGNHDQVKQDLSSTVGAAYLCTDQIEHNKFMEAVAGAGLDMVSTPANRFSDALVGGIPLKELAKSANLNLDYSSFHHNHPSLWYGLDLIFEGRSYVEILAALTNQAVPETYTFKGNGFDGVYRYACTLATNDGVLMHMRSPEYDCCYGGGLLAFCYGGAIRKDPKGAYLEMRAAQILSRHTRAVRQYDYHRGSWAKAAMAFLIHQINPGGPYSSTNADSLKSLRGIQYYKSIRAVIHRTEDKWASFVWGGSGSVGSGGPGGYVVPADPEGPLLYNTSDSLSGSILEHRPWWVYSILILIMVVGIVVLYICRHHSGNSVSTEISAFITAAGFFSVIYILVIDLQYTTIMRLPNAVVPRWSFSVVNIAATLILIYSASFLKFNHYKQWLWPRSLIMALMVIPISLLSMTRTPWKEISHSSGLFKMEWLYLIALFATAIMASLSMEKKHTRKIVLGLGSFVLLFSLVGLAVGYSTGNSDPLYLRFVSIKNIPRIKILFFLGAVSILIAFGLKLIRMPQIFIFAAMLSFVFMFSCIPIAFLSMGRFKQLPTVKHMKHKVTENGFSTAGEAITPSVSQRQAFFSFNDGPCITMINILSKRNSTLSYSGLPVAFYQRNGFVPPRFVHHAQGGNDIASLGVVESPWWCVDGKIGMTFAGGETEIRGIRRLGSNWARTESYLDRMDIIFASPLFRRPLKKGQKLIQMAAGIYPGILKNDMQKMASLFKYLDDKKLPPGWVGAIAPGKGNNCFLSIANLSDSEATAIVKVKWDGWVPVLSAPSVIKADRSELTIKLKPFETYGEKGLLFIKERSNKPIQVKKLRPSSYEFIPLEGPSVIVLRWQGPKKKELTYKQSANSEKIDIDSISSLTGHNFQIDEKTTVVVE